MGGHEVYAYNRSEESSARAKQRVKESMDSLKKNGVYTDSEAENFVPHPLRPRWRKPSEMRCLFRNPLPSIMKIKKHALVKRN